MEDYNTSFCSLAKKEYRLLNSIGEYNALDYSKIIHLFCDKTNPLYQSLFGIEG